MFFCLFAEDFTSSLPQTSSYISDDCKVLYIETIIEVNKPVFYERTNHISEMISSNSIENHVSTDSSGEELSYPIRSPRLEASNDEQTVNNSSTVPKRNGFLFPPTNGAFEETSRPTLSNRLEQQRVFERTHRRTRPYRRIILRPTPTIRRSLFQQLSRALKVGLLILIIPLLIYWWFLDQCTRSTIARSIVHRIIRIERNGLPLF